MRPGCSYLTLTAAANGFGASNQRKKRSFGARVLAGEAEGIGALPSLAARELGGFARMVFVGEGYVGAISSAGERSWQRGVAEMVGRELGGTKVYFS